MKKSIYLLIGMVVLFILGLISFLYFTNQDDSNDLVFTGLSVGFGAGTYRPDGYNIVIEHSGILGSPGVFNVTIKNNTRKNIKYLITFEVDNFDTTKLSYYSNTVCAKANNKTTIDVKYDAISNGSYKPYIINVGSCD